MFVIIHPVFPNKTRGGRGGCAWWIIYPKPASMDGQLAMVGST
jgi:hypothetical protein